MGFSLELASFMDLDLGVFTFRKIPGNDSLSLFPFVGSDVHFESLYVFSSVDEVLFGKVELTYFSVVLGNLSVVRSSNLWGLVLYELNCAIPLSSGKSGLNCLVEDISLNEVFNSEIKLLLRDQPVSPLFFQGDNHVWLSTF